MNSKDLNLIVKRAEDLPNHLPTRITTIRIIPLALAAFAFLLTLANAQSQPSVSEMLADTASLGSGWARTIYLQFDSVPTPSEVVQTIKAPPESMLNEWRRVTQDPNGKISGWVLAHYSLVSVTNRPGYEVQLERYRSHENLVTDFEKLLNSTTAQPGSMPLTQIGDAAAFVADAQGTGAKVWLRRGNCRVRISRIGAPGNWQQDSFLRLLAQAIDQRIAAVTLKTSAVADGAAALKRVLEEAIKSPDGVASASQSVAKVGDAFIPLNKISSERPISFAFDHWRKQGSGSDSLAVFRLTNSSPGSILFWNVRVQNPADDASKFSPGWKTIQEDYPSATSAVCEPGSAIEFWVAKPIITPWRVCILYSQELPASDRPKDTQRTWSGNYEAIGQPVH